MSNKIFESFMFIIFLFSLFVLFTFPFVGFAALSLSMFLIISLIKND